MPVQYCFDDCSFVAYSKDREPDSPSCFSFSRLSWIFVVFCFHKIFEFFFFFYFSSSVKNVIGNVIGIALNLSIALSCIVILTIFIISIQEHDLYFC